MIPFSFVLLFVGSFLLGGCSTFSGIPDPHADNSGVSSELPPEIVMCEKQLNEERQRRQRIQHENLKLVQWQEEQEAKYQDLARTLQEDVGNQVHVRPESHQLTITVLDQILFDSGETSLKPSGIRVLHDIGPILQQVHDQEIRIEGHSDNLPLRGRLKRRYPSNWELSTARATEVIRHLIDQHQVEPERLLALGYADTRPVASNDTEEGRQQNRRIEIVLSPKVRAPILAQHIASSE